MVLPKISNQHPIKPLGLPPVHSGPRGQRRVLTDILGTCSARANGGKLHGTKSLASSAKKMIVRKIKEEERERNRMGQKDREQRERGDRGKERGDNKI